MSNVTVLEFNELNFEVLDNLVKQGKLPNFKKLMANHRVAKTIVSEEYSKLEPWIQWVTAHTGKRQDQHGAFNLSDVQHTKLRQIWDVLEARGVACGVVSPMNARRGELTKGFFIPDPWSVSNDTLPPQLTPIYQFLAERIQSHNVSLEQGSSKLGFAIAVAKAGVPLSAIARMGLAYVKTKLDKRNKWKLAAELDRFLWEVTATLQRKFKTEYTSVFLNAVAHFQHHYWTSHAPSHWGKKYPKLFKQRNPVSDVNLAPGDDPVTYGLKTYDYILGQAINTSGIDSVIVITGLSQIPFEGYAEDSGFYLYRPYDHAKTFAALNIKYKNFSPLMSRDAMLYFDDDVSRDAAMRIFESAKINDKPLFLCTQETESRLFCKVTYSYDVDINATVDAEGVPKGAIIFNEHFLLITFKTGHHSPEGFLIAPAGAFSKSLADQSKSIPLENFPELVLRTMRLNDAEGISHELQLSAAN
jgi:hypothetical protein